MLRKSEVPLYEGRCVMNVTECIVCVPGYDLLTFSFLFLFPFDWVGVLWPQSGGGDSSVVRAPDS